MRHWLDPLIFFHQGNVANTVECFLWVRNLSCVSFVAIFVSQPYLWESDRIGCFVACFSCLNNLGRSKSRFCPFVETQLKQSAGQSTGVSKLAPQQEKDYGTCGNGKLESSARSKSCWLEQTSYFRRFWSDSFCCCQHEIQCPNKEHDRNWPFST